MIAGFMPDRRASSVATGPTAATTVGANRVVAFYNQRGTAEQWIKEDKNADKWTPCPAEP